MDDLEQMRVRLKTLLHSAASNSKTSSVNATSGTSFLAQNRQGEYSNKHMKKDLRDSLDSERSLLKEINDLNKRILTLQRSLKADAQRHSKEKSQLNQKIESLNDQLQFKESKIEMAMERICDLENALKLKNEKIDLLMEELNSVRPNQGKSSSSRRSNAKKQAYKSDTRASVDDDDDYGEDYDDGASEYDTINLLRNEGKKYHNRSKNDIGDIENGFSHGAEFDTRDLLQNEPLRDHCVDRDHTDNISMNTRKLMSLNLRTLEFEDTETILEGPIYNSNPRSKAIDLDDDFYLNVRSKKETDLSDYNDADLDDFEVSEETEMSTEQLLGLSQLESL